MARKTHSLDDALAAKPYEEIDNRIGDRALSTYEETVAAARANACEAIVSWWREQPPEVVDELIDAMRERDQIVVENMQAGTAKDGVELLAELIAEDGMNGGRWVYEREMEHRLTMLRAAGACDDGFDKPSIHAALAGLSEDETSRAFGIIATKMFVAEVIVHERDEADSIVRGWAGRPWGKRAIQEIVATLTDNHTEEVLAATEKSTGGAHADLVEILRDDTTRELYTLLVTRIAHQANAAHGPR